MISLLACLLMGSLSAHQKPGAQLPFLIGAEWNPDASAQVQDLVLETGCNFVRLTGGGYGWAAPKHVASLKFLQPRGIYALVQLGSHWPDGKYTDHAADYFVDDKGVSGKKEGYAVTYSGQSWPQMTYASDGFRKSLEVDFASYLSQVKSFGNIAGLLLHNEPGYFWVDDRIFDYNPQAIAKFREWLPTQHRSIKELNDRWGTTFGSFPEVEPPHERPPVSNIGAWMDWRRFNAWLIQDFLKWESGFAKAQMPATPNMTNLSGPLDNWYPLRLGDNYRLYFFFRCRLYRHLRDRVDEPLLHGACDGHVQGRREGAPGHRRRVRELRFSELPKAQRATARRPAQERPVDVHRPRRPGSLHLDPGTGNRDLC